MPAGAGDEQLSTLVWQSPPLCQVPCPASPAAPSLPRRDKGSAATRPSSREWNLGRSAQTMHINMLFTLAE